MTDKKMQDIQIAVMQEQMNMAANMARAWANMKWGNGRYQAIVNMLSETSWQTDRDVHLEILKSRKETVLRFLHKCNERWKGTDEGRYSHLISILSDENNCSCGGRCKC